MQTRSQPMTAGNMPGGGAMKKMSASYQSKKWKSTTTTSKMSPKVHKLYTTPKPNELEESWYKKQTVNKIYTTKKSGETGKVSASKVASLKAKPNRPKPLKRKKTKLTKTEKKTLIQKRKESKMKYAVRSEVIMQELLFKKNALKRDKKKAKTLAKKQTKVEPMYPNILEMMYSIGPQPKYKTISDKFREYRKFAKAQMKCSKKSKSKSVSKKSEISYLYKVGQKKPMSAK